MPITSMTRRNIRQTGAIEQKSGPNRARRRIFLGTHPNPSTACGEHIYGVKIRWNRGDWQRDAGGAERLEPICWVRLADIGRSVRITQCTPVRTVDPWVEGDRERSEPSGKRKPPNRTAAGGLIYEQVM